MFRLSSKLIQKSVVSTTFYGANLNVRYMGTTYKTSTGLVGLAVDPNGRETLLGLSDQVLTAVQKIPATSGYRESVEKWFNFIKKTCVQRTDIKSIEDEIDLGQIEEVITFAQDELKLIDYYYDNKVWELVEESIRDADSLVAEMADSIYFTDPESRRKVVPPVPVNPKI